MHWALMQFKKLMVTNCKVANSTNLTLAILSPQQNAYSETFIQTHKKLPCNIKFYYSVHRGYQPTHLEDKGSLMQFSFRERIEKKIFKKFSLHEYGLYYSLRREKVEVVLAEYGPTAYENLPVIRALHLPLVVHFHGYDASAHSVVQHYATGYKEIFDYAKAVIVVSNKMKNDLQALGCPLNKLILSTYGPNPIFFKNKPNYASTQFLAVGRFVEKKAPHLTLLAFNKVAAKIGSARLVMVGDGPLLPFCKDLVKGLGLVEKVIFTGALPFESIKGLMESSIAFVQHSITAGNGDSEGTPVAVLEAQAAGLPVIATYHAGIPDVVVQNETGYLVDEHNVDCMGEYMLKILQPATDIKKMGTAARERVRNQFNLERYLHDLHEAIE